MKTWTLGNITETRLWAEVSRRPAPWPGRPFVTFGKTYNGTKAGVVARAGRYVLVAHLR